MFWKNSNKSINKTFMKEYKIPSLLDYSGASNSGLIQFTKKKVKQIFFIKVFQIKRNLRVPLGEN